MTFNEEKIKELCSSAPTDINMCRVAYAIIDNAPDDEKTTLLELFVTEFQNSPSSHSMTLPCFMDERLKRAMLQRYGQIIDAQITELQKMNLPGEEFYSNLWQYISTDLSLPTFESRVIALYNCAISEQLPYYTINRNETLSMEQKEFETVVSAIGSKNFGRLKAILNADFEQKTEQCSLIVSIMDSLKSFEERTVFLARLISHFRIEIHRMRLQNFAAGLLDRGLLGNPLSLERDIASLSGLDPASLFDDDTTASATDSPGASET